MRLAKIERKEESLSPSSFFSPVYLKDVWPKQTKVQDDEGGGGRSGSEGSREEKRVPGREALYT